MYFCQLEEWSCSDGYTMVLESCYKLITEEITHLEAELFCSDNETASLVAETTSLHVITLISSFFYNNNTSLYFLIF